MYDWYRSGKIFVARNGIFHEVWSLIRNNQYSQALANDGRENFRLPLKGLIVMGPSRFPSVTSSTISPTDSGAQPPADQSTQQQDKPNYGGHKKAPPPDHGKFFQKKLNADLQKKASPGKDGRAMEMNEEYSDNPFSQEETKHFSSLLKSFNNFIAHPDIESLIEEMSAKAEEESRYFDGVSTPDRTASIEKLDKRSGERAWDMVKNSEREKASALLPDDQGETWDMIPQAERERDLKKIGEQDPFATEWASIPSEERENALTFFKKAFALASETAKEWKPKLQQEFPDELRRHYEAFYEISNLLGKEVADTPFRKALFGSLCAATYIHNIIKNASEAEKNKSFSAMAARLVTTMLLGTFTSYLTEKLVQSVGEGLNEKYFDNAVKHKYSGYVIPDRSEILGDNWRGMQKIIHTFLECVVDGPTALLRIGKIVADIKKSPGDFFTPSTLLAVPIEAIPHVIPKDKLPLSQHREIYSRSREMDILDANKHQIAGLNALPVIREQEKSQKPAYLASLQEMWLQGQLFQYAARSLRSMDSYFSLRTSGKTLVKSRLPATITGSKEYEDVQTYITTLKDIHAFSSSPASLKVSYNPDENDKKITFRDFTYSSPDKEPLKINRRDLTPEVPLSVRVPRQLEKEAPAPYDLDLPIDKGTCVQVVGGNGDGKSTLMAALIDGLTFAKGTVNIPFDRDQIVLLGADPFIDSGRTLRQNIFWPNDAETSKSKEEQDAFLLPLLERLEVRESFEKKLDQGNPDLSTGEKRIVEWLRLFEHLDRGNRKGKPKQLLISDESTLGISVNNKTALNDILKDMAPDIAVLGVSHGPMFRNVDRVVRVTKYKASLLSISDGLEELKKLKESDVVE